VIKEEDDVVKSTRPKIETAKPSKVPNKDMRLISEKPKKIPQPARSKSLALRPSSSKQYNDRNEV